MTQFLSYDPAAVMIPEHGITPEQLADLSVPLDEARDEVLADSQLWLDGVEPAERAPLDAGFTEMPDRLLAEFRNHGEKSTIAHLQATAERLASEVDRVVSLGIGGSYMGARALLEACCHPYYNELPRDLRQGRPRMTFEGNNVDNDAMRGLFDLLDSDRASDSDWAIVVISKSGGTLETAAAFRALVEKLRDHCGGDAELLARRIVPVTGASGKLADLADALGCPERYEVPDGVGGRFSVLSAVGLLPAAIMGLDVVRLLEGAEAMNEHFRNSGPGNNIVLAYVGVCHLMETLRGCDIRLLSSWGKQLEGLGLWYDQLLSESLGKDERGAMPLTVVNTRDLHSRGQQHQEGKRDKLITNLIVDSVERDPVAIGHSDFDQDGLNELARKTLPDILAAATQGTNHAYRDAGRPTADLHLPRVDEFIVGQLLQMLMLATVVEGRLIDINPYGQPGVQAYKTNMNAILRK
ncbi:glucose-6-phosphate isomerase [Pirellulales bacterium]|nr:glucose-6-phosphate isomerase [Pirellulales bacterium]